MQRTEPPNQANRLPSRPSDRFQRLTARMIDRHRTCLLPKIGRADGSVQSSKRPKARLPPPRAQAKAHALVPHKALLPPGTHVQDSGNAVATYPLIRFGYPVHASSRFWRNLHGGGASSSKLPPSIGGQNASTFGSLHLNESTSSSGQLCDQPLQV
jgi:hypothetical protein